MSAPVIAATTGQWPAEVLEFAARENVRPYLEPLLEATRQVFPAARWIKVYVGHDPEIRDLAHIVFDVQVAGLDATQGLGAQNRWNRELMRLCPAPLACTFTLLMDLVR